MKRLTLLFIAGVLLLTPSVFAWDCNTRVQYNSLGLPWEYVINRLETADDTTCWSVDTGGYQWNTNDSKWEFTSFVQKSFSRTMTLGSGRATGLVTQCNVVFYDPNASWWNFIGIDLDVNHNGSHTVYTVYSNRGNQGNTNDSGAKYINFDAVEGDVLTLRVTGANSYLGSGTKVQFGGCYLWQYPN